MLTTMWSLTSPSLCSVELEKTGLKLYFGVRHAKVKVFRPTGQGAGEADKLEVANNLLTGMQRNEPAQNPAIHDENRANLKHCATELHHGLV